MESVVNPGRSVLDGASVFVTGHTGFKGGWLSLWLRQLGAQVHGFALDPPTHPGFFDATALGEVLASDTRGDIRDLDRLRHAMRKAKPVAVFHLAAQPLVIDSYAAPVETFDVNVLGTAKVLEAARETESLRGIVVVTTDKVYENREWPHPYRENDALGGHDPYSASKGASEIIAASYRSSFFGDSAKHPANLATARAGNVIGGGDWASNRLIPDCFRSFAADEPVQLRYPDAVRPWQHVLDPVGGYIRLAEALVGGDGADFARSWNFGPDADSDATVGEVARLTCRLMGDAGRYRLPAVPATLHEAGLLRLDSSLARSALGWRPRWALEEAVARTVDWHQAWLSGQDMKAFSERQISDFQSGIG
ncbi:MAG: CDP-glucose 4,6-dehydratase [Brevundimonas sp.]|nr:MAG: CDP-glucose 4,6-dehydratase [Brevundimonas sp.]